MSRESPSSTWKMEFEVEVLRWMDGLEEKEEEEGR